MASICTHLPGKEKKKKKKKRKANELFSVLNFGERVNRWDGRTYMLLVRILFF
jgi:hypothetical protein